MIIISRTPNQIKHFINEVGKRYDESDIQEYVEAMYTKACAEFKEQIKTTKNKLVFTFPMENTTTVTFIRSSNKRVFTMDAYNEITLRIYQIRSTDRKHYEDILVEPFYPSFKASLNVIYEILLVCSSKSSEHHNMDLERLAASYSKRSLYYIRQRFYSRWTELFGQDKLPLRTFEEFYNIIHHMNPMQLQSLFSTDITFV